MGWGIARIDIGDGRWIVDDGVMRGRSMLPEHQLLELESWVGGTAATALIGIACARMH